MEEIRVKFDYIEPENVESEVPGEQTLRVGGPDISDFAIANTTDAEGDKIENPEHYVLAPVMTVTKKEATLTKGDMKLQKVSVTENISADQNGVHPVKDPSHPHSEVTLDPQQTRTMENEERRTRIPTRFKQAVSRMKRDRSMPDRKENEAPTQSLPRRSSIPRLRTRVHSPKPEEDEFDKIYDEIVDSSIDIDISLLNNKVDDPIKVENRFEEIIHDYDEGKIKPINVERPKHSKIPMLKRKSEAEIEVPKSVQNATNNNSSSDKTNVKDTNSKSAEDEDVKHRKIPTRIAVSKKIVVDNDNNNVRGSYQRTTSKTVTDGDKHQLQVENVDVKVSYQSDISPEHVVVDNVTSVADIQESSVEIVEVDPLVETVETSSIINEPSYVEIVEASPVTAPIVENSNNHQVYIEEIYKKNTNDLSPKHEVTSTEIVTETITVEPVKIVSKEEFETLINRDFNRSAPNAPVNDQNRLISEVLPSPPIKRTADNGIDTNNHIPNNDKVQKEEELVDTEPVSLSPAAESKPSIKDEIEDDSTILRGKVDRMITRLTSREDKDEIKKDSVEELPKPKSVLSKIAMFERQEPTKITKKTLIPKIETRNKPDEYRPKIVNEILKPVQRNANINNDYSNDYNTLHEPKSLEINNIGKNKAHEVSKAYLQVEEIAVSTPFITDRAITEEATTINEANPYYDFNTNPFEQVKVNHVSPPSYREELPKPAEIINEIELKPVEIEYVEPTFIKTAHNEDTVLVNHMNETAHYDAFRTKREKPESPFHFTPSLYSDTKREKLDSPFNFIRSESKRDETIYYTPDFDKEKVEVEYSIDDTPSLDYVLDKFKKYKSSFEETNLKKAKSVAELDLGDAVKGKVHDMIVRMKSVDRSAEKKEAISAKERPRKKSVSEKIALFEGKLSINPLHNVSSRSVKTAPKVADVTISPELYQQKVSELSSAKLQYGRATNMTYLVLGNGQEMPLLGIGTALLDKQLTPHIVGAAIDLGYRAIDAAYIYGNEREVGDAIRAKIDDGTVTRKELFVTNKLWSTFHRKDLVEVACRKSLEVMGLDYFDLYLIHNPLSFKEGSDPIPKIANVIQYSDYDYLDAWYGMEHLVAKGLVKSIGISNFNSVQVQRVVDKARVRPVINMVECHPYLSQQRLDDFCAERNIKLLCFGVLGSKGTPQELKSSATCAIDDPLVQVMAAGLGVTPAQLLIRYQIEEGRGVVVKASSGSRLWDNLQALNFNLTEPQVDALRALNRNKRAFTSKGMGETHKNYPFNIPF